MIAETTKQIQISCVGFYISLAASKQRVTPSLKNIMFLVIYVKDKGPSLILIQQRKDVGVVWFSSLKDLFILSECCSSIQRRETVY